MTVYRLLMGLMYSRRFDRLFSEADANGQFATRPDVARAIIDWADGDEQMFSPDGARGAGEDYRYDARADRYRAHDNSYDTIEELKHGARRLRRLHGGVPAVPDGLRLQHRRCKVNLRAISNKNGGDCTPLLMGVIRAAAAARSEQAARPIRRCSTTARLYPMASVLCDRASAAGFDSLNTITNLMQNPQTAVLPDDPRYKIFQSMPPITVNDGRAGQARLRRARRASTGSSPPARSGKREEEDHRDRRLAPVARQPPDAQPGRREGRRRPPVLARGITDPWPTPSAASTSARSR